jgi:hypothetical protein
LFLRYLCDATLAYQVKFEQFEEYKHYVTHCVDFVAAQDHQMQPAWRKTFNFRILIFWDVMLPHRVKEPVT